MESDELRSIGLLGYDEKTETWYIDTREARRFVLNRQTIEGVVHMYNSIHSGGRLRLTDERTVSDLEEKNRRLSRAVRDLHLAIERERGERPCAIARILSRIAARISGRSFPRSR